MAMIDYNHAFIINRLKHTFKSIIDYNQCLFQLLWFYVVRTVAGRSIRYYIFYSNGTVQVVVDKHKETQS